MTIIGKFDTGFILSEESVAGPASYATATPPTIELSDLRQPEQVISLFIDSGHLCQIVSLVGQTVTFRIRGSDEPIASTAGDPGDETPDNVDHSGDTITCLAYGR